MPNNTTNWIRIWAFALCLVALPAAFLAAQVNPFEVGVAYITLLAGVIAVGLISNPWGGLIASAITVFVMVSFYQYAGIYPREGIVVNVASQLATFLAVGPLAGALGAAIVQAQQQTAHWLSKAEETQVHDDFFGTLKPEWAKIRLEEELLRAQRFARPLTLTLLRPLPGPNASPADLTERVAILKAVIRIAQAYALPPAIITHAGGDDILLILPEHTVEQAQTITHAIENQFELERFYPAAAAGQGLGMALTEWGALKMATVGLNGRSTTADALLQQLRAS